MNDIVKQCLAMSRENREHLIVILKESLKDKPESKHRFNHLLECATMIVGDGILSDSRTIHCVIGRQMIAYQMHIEGYGWSEIGRLMGRNHATIINLARRIQGAFRYPDYFRMENALWKEFQRLIKQ